MIGAQWVFQALRTLGVETSVWLSWRGAIMPVYDALYDGGVEHLLCCHEQGAVVSVIGYARATGKIGVCIATSGPSAPNLITGLVEAMINSVLIVAITSQVSSAFIGTDAFQEIDVLGLSLACTNTASLNRWTSCPQSWRKPSLSLSQVVGVLYWSISRKISRSPATS